ncbi:MAG TPA: isoleucine--tRNA ligase [Firmicutes bacterium]|nr:isoleucine--tRNA ligase [Bacillota bacterium]
MFKKVTSDVDFPKLEEDIIRFWNDRQIFKKSLELRQGKDKFVFYEGPPTANGLPHPGHVLTRAIKDVFLRYKAMCGYLVERKGGWDTHGLPVELEVEKELGINGKPDIERYGVGKFIERCKESVFKYKREWERMTERVGFWIDLDDAYITYTDDYIESVWWALRQIWDKGLLYQGYKVVPYCPRCGTALSSHEVAQGYEEVKDPSVYVKFPVSGREGTFFLVWTTTPWTLPSNVALAVSPDYDYALIRVKATGEKFILAKGLLDAAVKEEYEVLDEFKGKALEGTRYEPIFPYARPDKPAFYVVTGDFVTLEEGTGIVHIAPAFGDDDMRMAREHDLPVVQLVDVQGRFTDEVEPWKGMFVKEADPLIIKAMQEKGSLYRAEDYLHTYPFCWRCDTPLLYYARSSWFIKTTAIKDELLRNNRAIDWRPEHIKEGRMGNFLENVIDWAVSRERYWGTPLNVWICDDCGHQHCVGSIKELKDMAKALPEHFELHRPYIDEVVLRCPECGGDAHRVKEVIDAWFDSGSMPYAQWHYPFEHQDTFRERFPADFITEAIDQTRGWFYTLLVNSTLLFGKAPYRHVVVLGHVLDREGLKMSKHKGNVVDTWSIFNEYGADAMRWYLYTVNAPWTPTRFYPEAIGEASRRFLGTLWNVYSFFVLYANIDGFNPREHALPVEERSLLDRWIISRLNHVVQDVRRHMEDYDVSAAAREIEAFVDDLSNWYVRRSRQRYWGPEMTRDKVAAYLTLYEVLITVAKLAAPFVPFTSEEIYRNLELSHPASGSVESVHLCDYPVADPSLVSVELERDMALARQVVYLGRAARNKVNIKNRQPLSRLVVVASGEDRDRIARMQDIILGELNVKTLDFAESIRAFVDYEVKPRFDILGPRLGRLMPKVQAALKESDGASLVGQLERAGKVTLGLPGGEHVTLSQDELLIQTHEREGSVVVNEGGLSIALDVTITPELYAEGLAREMINKVQAMRKEADFNIEDRIAVRYWSTDKVRDAITSHRAYVMEETLARVLEYDGTPDKAEPEVLEAGTAVTRAWDLNGEPVVISVRCIDGHDPSHDGEENHRLRHEVSAGGVVFRDGKVLVLRNHRSEWVLPKGHVEPGEDPEQAALREVKEESGLECRITGPTGVTRYRFTSEVDGATVSKSVFWFAMEPLDAADPVPNAEEGFSVAEFMDLEEAVATLTFDGALVKETWNTLVQEKKNLRRKID